MTYALLTENMGRDDHARFDELLLEEIVSREEQEQRDQLHALAMMRGVAR